MKRNYRQIFFSFFKHTNPVKILILTTKQFFKRKQLLQDSCPIFVIKITSFNIQLFSVLGDIPSCTVGPLATGGVRTLHWWQPQSENTSPVRKLQGCKQIYWFGLSKRLYFIQEATHLSLEVSSLFLFTTSFLTNTGSLTLDIQF